jgi:pantothenate synthetase
VLLSEAERADAVGLNRGLRELQSLFETGERSGSTLRSGLHRTVASFPLLRLQYGEIVHPETLDPQSEVTPGSVAVVAAHCGPTRLIDNHILTA